MDKTFAEIRDAFIAGYTCIVDNKAMITAVIVGSLLIYTGMAAVYDCEGFDEYPQEAGEPT